MGSEYSNGASMKGIDYVVNEKGQVIAVQVDLKQRGAAWDELWDGVVSESRRTEKSIPYAQYRTKRATQKPSLADQSPLGMIASHGRVFRHG